MPNRNSLWWGPPKKFSTQSVARKISWLELFYDLVYAVVISKVTYYLAHHTTQEGILDYIYLFIMIFWGWFNGSMYYDLHASPGVRTMFMTLWQMVAVAALAATLGSPSDKLIFCTTISIAVLQAYITYLWWSVGIYDKEHRKRNVPYTLCYVAAFVLIITTLYVPHAYIRILFGLTLLFNYIPPFLIAARVRRRGDNFTISSSMVERLGLFTIIVFGEAILGVINSMNAFAEMNMNAWLCFVLGILIVFSLWWIFFGIISDRESKKGFISGQVMSVIYIPTLASLGMVGSGFPALMATLQPQTNNATPLAGITYGISLTIFLCSIAVISRFLVYPQHYQKAKRILQPILVMAGALILLITLAFHALPLIAYLLSIFLILLVIIVIIMRSWYVVERKNVAESN